MEHALYHFSEVCTLTILSFILNTYSLEFNILQSLSNASHSLSLCQIVYMYFYIHLIKISTFYSFIHFIFIYTLLLR